MKLAGMIALTFVLIASLFTGCGCDGRTPTDASSSSSTESTASTTTTQAPTTAPAPTTTAATEPTTTAGTVPSTDGQLPDGDPVPDSTNGSGNRGIVGRGTPLPLQ